ncbi:NUDIX hydrolase OS=Streptomyces alboniger OX=132473 GN=CP975_16490 PE=4 SV=1 [Streptomyces alboniger]
MHRPKYDDWSWPKGKLKRGEDHLVGARREVAEETGYNAAPGAELSTVRYVANGHAKEVRYWGGRGHQGHVRPERRGGPHPLAPRVSRPHSRLTQHRDRTLIDELLVRVFERT